MKWTSEYQELEAAKQNIKKHDRWGIVTILCVGLGGYHFFPLSLPPMPTPVERLTFTLRWQLPSLCMLFLGIWVVLTKRSNSRAMDPVSGKDADQVEVHVRYIQNTLEQLVLSCGSQLILTTHLDQSSMRWIPILVFLFVLGRITFWIGYIQEDLSRTNRAFGVGVTLFPTAINMAYCMLCFLMDLM